MRITSLTFCSSKTAVTHHRQNSKMDCLDPAPFLPLLSIFLDKYNGLPGKAAITNIKSG